MKELLMATVIILSCCFVAHAETLIPQEPDGGKNNFGELAEQVYERVSEQLEINRERRPDDFGNGNASSGNKGKNPPATSSGNYELLGGRLRSLATGDNTP